MVVIIVLSDQQVIVKKLESTGTLQNVLVPVRQRSARNVENIATAEASVEEIPNVPLTRRSQALGISVTSLWRISRNYLGLHPYKIKLTQKLKPLDHQKCCIFVNWAEQQLENDSDYYRQIIFSDMAHFWLTKPINKICIIGQTAIHTYFMSHHCILKKLRFGAVYGPAASLGRDP